MGTIQKMKMDFILSLVLEHIVVHLKLVAVLFVFMMMILRIIIVLILLIVTIQQFGDQIMLMILIFK